MAKSGSDVAGIAIVVAAVVWLFYQLKPSLNLSVGGQPRPASAPAITMRPGPGGTYISSVGAQPGSFADVFNLPSGQTTDISGQAPETTDIPV